VHLVGFIIRIYHDARSPECQKKEKVPYLLPFNILLIKGMLSFSSTHFLLAPRLRKNEDTRKPPSCDFIMSSVRTAFRQMLGKGSVSSTLGLGPITTARGQSIGISIDMLPQTLIMSITVQKTSKYYTTEFDLEEGF